MSIEIRKKEKLLQQEQWAYLSTHPSKRLHSLYFDDDDEDYTSAITPDEPVLSTEEPDNSLSMGDEHLDTISATESDQFIKSSVENLIPIPNQIEDFSESNKEFSSIDDNSFSIDDIDYVAASPPDPELVSSKVMEIVIPEPQFSINYESEPGYIANYNSYPYDSSSFPQQYLCCENCGSPHETFQCQIIHQPPQEMSIQEMEDLKKQYLDEMKRLINFQYRDEIKIDELKGNFNIRPSLSTEEPDNSLSMGDENLDTISETESDEFIKSSVENLILIPSESEGGIDDDFLLTIKDDILRKKLLNINLLIAKIEALNDNLTPSFDFMTKYSSTSLNSLLEETNSFDNSLPEFETFYFDLEEISSGNTTTHYDSSLYDSFIFDLSINLFPSADMSDFYEFADELIHIISPPEYDCFFFKIEPNSKNFTMDLVEDISPTRELRVHNAFPTHPTLQLNLEFKLSSESLFTYVVWIFLPFFLYSVAPQYLLSLGNEDTIFDPGICSHPISSF
nr:hypothetical protein [Tanacetum cinerariifolium]